MSDYYSHPTAIIDQGAIIGNGTRIWHRSHIMQGAKIGDNCNLGENTFVENNVTLGNQVTVKNNVALYTGIECEDDVFIGPNCVFTNVLYPRSFIPRKDEFQKTIVKRGATLGANCTIVCGITIGRYAMIGAGAVVTKNVPDHSLLVGNPAHTIGYVCECGERLIQREGETYYCKRCGKRYYMHSGVLEEKNAK